MSDLTVEDRPPADRDHVAQPPSRGSWFSPTGTFLTNLYFFWLTPVALLLGVVLRTREWLHDKSLWLDEIMISQNVIQRGFGQLTQPLSLAQSAPIPWLWAERASINLFGVHELTLRLVPFLGSLVALGVFPMVARRLVGRGAAPAATLLVATSPALIYYAAETKQYSTDAACALLAVWVTIRLLDRAPDYRSALLWALTCGALVWCSQPTILVAGAAAVCLLLRWARKSEHLLPVLAGAVLLGLIVGLDWLFTLRRLSAVDSLQTYWQARGGFPPLSATVAEELSWLKFVTLTFGAEVGHFVVPALAIALALWGLATTARLRRWSAVLIALILLAAVGAAATHHYPLMQRLALYLFPFAALLLTAGLDDATPPQFAPRNGTTGEGAEIRHSLPRPWRYLSASVCAIALLITTGPMVAAGIGKLGAPDDTDSGRQAIEFVSLHQEPSDVVLGDFWTGLTFAFYGPRYGVTRNGVVAFVPTKPGQCQGNRLESLSGTSRVWLVLAHHPTNEPPDRNAIYQSQFAAAGTLVSSYEGAGGAGAYLYDLGEPPSTPQPPSPATWLRNGCFTIKIDHPKA